MTQRACDASNADASSQKASGQPSGRSTRARGGTDSRVSSCSDYFFGRRPRLAPPDLDGPLLPPVGRI